MFGRGKKIVSCCCTIFGFVKWLFLVVVPNHYTCFEFFFAGGQLPVTYSLVAGLNGKFSVLNLLGCCLWFHGVP